MCAVKVKCFEITELEVAEVKFTALKLVKELVLDGYPNVDQLSLSEFKDSDLLRCDCVLLSSCEGSQCSEVFEYVKAFKTPSVTISPRPDKLVGLSILMKPADGKEVDVFYGSQLEVKDFEVPSDTYVFEGDLSFKSCDACLGLMLKTESGIRLLLSSERAEVSTPKKAVKRRRKKRRVRRRSKKKR